MNSIDRFTAGGVFTTDVYRHSAMSRALESGDPAKVAHVANQINLGIAQGGYELLSEDVQHNIIPNEALDNLLNVWLTGSAQVSSRYVALFSADSTPAATWTSANFHATNTTEFEGYSESTRPLWNHGTVATQSISNSANKAVFTITSPATLYGAALLSASAKDGTGDSSGLLYAATRFSASRPVVATDVVNVQYDLTAASA